MILNIETKSVYMNAKNLKRSGKIKKDAENKKRRGNLHKEQAEILKEEIKI